MVDPDHVRAFTHVVQAGSFTAAAGQLGLPKSSVSRRVSALEAELGARLLHRSTRALRLTDVGEVFFARTVRALEDLDEAVRAVDQLQGAPRGVLRITAPVDVGTFLAQVVALFMEEYPEVRVVLLATGRRVDLVTEGFDLALRAGPMPDSSLVARKLTESRLGLYASRDYLHAHGTPEEPQDLAGQRLLLFGSERLESTLTLRGPGGTTRLNVQGVFASNDCDVLRAAAEQHMGITLLPTLAEAYQDLRNLRRVLPEHSAPGGGLFVVYPSHRHLSPKVRAFIDFLSGQLPPDWR